MADTSKDELMDGLLLGGGIRHITATQTEVKKFLLVYVGLLTAPVLPAECVTTGNGLKNGVHCGL